MKSIQLLQLKRTLTDPNILIQKEIEKIQRNSISQLQELTLQENTSSLNENTTTEMKDGDEKKKDVEIIEIDDESDLEVYNILSGNENELEIFHDVGNENVIELTVVSDINLTVDCPAID